MLAPANPIWRTCISSPSAGAAVNWIIESINVYDLAVFLSLGCWTTPLIDTITLSLFAGIVESVNSVVLPSPVKLSTSLSRKSKFSIVFAIMLPQKTSFTVGAVLKTILWLSCNANPSVKLLGSRLGLWITLLIATFIWVALFNLAALPVSYTHLRAHET